MRRRILRLIAKIAVVVDALGRYLDEEYGGDDDV